MMWRKIFMLLTAVTLSVGCAGGQEESSSSEFVTSSPQTTMSVKGMGDPLVPWAGNQDYDVGRYDWHLRLDPLTGGLAGTAAATATALAHLEMVSLDYLGPDPVAVRVDGEDVMFDYAKPKLHVTADIPAGDQFIVEVDIDGIPETAAGEPGWTHVGQLIYTLAVLPGDTARWIPLNDTPLDPAIFSVEADLPPEMSIVASGVPIGADTWETPVPVSEFGMAVGAFERRDVGSPRSPQVTVFSPMGGPAPSRAAIDDVVAEMLAHHERFLGPFPLSTLGVTTITGVNFANSTPGQIFLGTVDPLTVAHELGHQWIGGSVGTAATTDTWLREGIPEYLALSWIAEADGRSLDERMRSIYEALPPTTRVLREVDEPEDRSDRATYERSPLAIHALRREVGEDAFVAGLQAFVSQYEGRSATTEQFIQAMQAETDSDVEGLLGPWIDHEALPPFP